MNTNFSMEFIKAFNELMKSEVGPNFDPTDSATINGLIDTSQNRKKCGYVNIKTDNGGETKFGIAQKFNPNINVSTMTLEQAMQCCFDTYWILNHCDKLAHPLNVIHLDGAYNHGSSQETKFLQRAAKIDSVDGILGPNTMKIICSLDPMVLSLNILDQRTEFFTKISAKPGQAIFLKGWLNRIDGLRSFLKTA